jgi:hypothetical protein
LSNATAYLAVVLEQVSREIIGAAIRRTVSFNARNAKKCYVIEREPLDFPFHMKTLTDALLKRLYRLGKQYFTNLARAFEPELHHAQTRPHGIAYSVNLNWLAITVRYLAGANVLDLSWPYGLATSTVCAVIDATLDTLNTLLNNIKFAKSTTDCENEILRFRLFGDHPCMDLLLRQMGLRSRFVARKHLIPQILGSILTAKVFSLSF